MPAFLAFSLIICIMTPTQGFSRQSNEFVKNSVNLNSQGFSKCYKLRRGIKNKSGKLTLQWYVNSYGKAERIKYLSKDSTISNHKILSCVKSEVKKMNFPAAPKGKPLLVTYPFIFKVRKK